VGQIFVESTKKHIEKAPIWRLCFVVSQGRKDTPKQIQKKMVWSIQGIILFFLFLLTILNQTQDWLMLTS
jgi:hypothetical protein